MTPENLEKLRNHSIAKLSDDAALDHIGHLIDASSDAKFARGADRALFLLNELGKRSVSDRNATLIEYYRANSWAVKEDAAGDRSSWAWEHPDREQQLLSLSRAISHPGFMQLDDIRRCQILTNRANQLDVLGRFVDAVEGWDAALGIMPNFAMSLANRGFGLKHYGGMMEDDRDRAIFLLNAHDCLLAASLPDAVFDSVYPEELTHRFAAEAQSYAAAANLDKIRDLLNSEAPSLGRSKAERAYRHWALDNRLFLNPLNDLGPLPRAASDDLVLPPIRESFEDRPDSYTPPPIISFFNQIKQEYVSARYMLYEGLTETKLHFSDRKVQLFDTLDFPMHSLATEKVRAAYRISYSLLDKLAFLIDHYWKLGKVTDRINFRNVWMVEGKSRLHSRFHDYANWPLRGLFWLSKELFDDQLKRTTGPDARELHDIRNALEHKFLQVHEGWALPFMSKAPSGNGFSFSIDSDFLETKALRVMKISRAAMIQVSLAIGVEERAKALPDVLVGSMPLVGLEDARKRRDPQ